MRAISRFYSNMVFKRPLMVIVLLLCFTATMAWYAQYFRLDASSDSLLMEGDAELELLSQDK